MWFPSAFAVDEDREDFVSAAFENLTHPTLLTWSDFKLCLSCEILYPYTGPFDDCCLLGLTLCGLIQTFRSNLLLYSCRKEAGNCTAAFPKTSEIIYPITCLLILKGNNPRSISCTLHLKEIDHQTYYYTVSWVTHSVICSKFRLHNQRLFSYSFLVLCLVIPIKNVKSE